jgi:anthranilate/para-aminobenzoate synthase component I
MQLIAAHEVTTRGPYCGALVVFDPEDRVHASVAIRTGVLAAGQFRFHAGGAVTADSVPEDEYDELLDKTAVMLEALT